nr:peroxiredoxin [Flexivirga aerilata]
MRATDGSSITVSQLGAGRSIVYLYPMTGQPGHDLPTGWDDIPGARGCTPEACSFRDHLQELRDAGAERVFGLSSQTTDYQAEVAERLHLPFPLLSDPDFALGDALRLPTFSAEGHQRLYSRLTLVIRDGKVKHAFYPVFPPNTHAEQVVSWLRDNTAVGNGAWPRLK